MSDAAAKGGRPNRKEFRRVREAKGDDSARPASKDNEVRIVASRGQRMYIKYAIEILTGAEDKKKSDTVILSGMGNAVYNVVNVCEILKRRVKGLHQITEIGSQTMTDKYEAVEEGKPGMEVERKVSVIEITLSTTTPDTNHSGYQAPLPESEVTEQDERANEPRERRPKKEGAKREGAKKEGGRKGGDRKSDDKKPRRNDDREERRGGRRDDRDDRAPARGGRGGSTRGGRGGRRDDRDERRRDDRPAARGGRGGSDRPARGGRGGSDRRDDRDDRRGDDRRGGGRRDDRDDRAPSRGGRGGYSEGRREGGRGGSRSDRGGARRN